MQQDSEMFPTCNNKNNNNKSHKHKLLSSVLNSVNILNIQYRINLTLISPASNKQQVLDFTKTTVNYELHQLTQPTHLIKIQLIAK